jgi:glycolate oxidase FAD binding subunit
MIRVEGFEASVDYRVGRLRQELAGFGDIAIESDPQRTAADWRWVRDVETFAGRQGAVWKISLKPSDGPDLVAGLKRSLDAQALYDWGGGLVWLLVPEEGDCGAATIRERLGRLGGHAMLFRASEKSRKEIAVFQPETPVITAISAGLRRQFDPAGILNPGRMGVREEADAAFTH